MKNFSRRGFLKTAAASAAVVAAAGTLAGCGGNPGSNSSEETKEEAFMSEGKGQHLVCAVTGKLLSFLPGSEWLIGYKRK